MSAPDMKALSDASTQGQFVATFTPDLSTFICIDDSDHTIVAQISTAGTFDAAYIAALVNAHRAGQLFTAADVDAAVLAEREACAKVAEQRWREWGNLAPHSAVEFDVTACEDIAAAIRARKPIPD